MRRNFSGKEWITHLEKTLQTQWFFSVHALWGGGGYQSHSLHWREPSFCLYPNLKLFGLLGPFWISVCELRFPGGNMLKSIDELWFGLYFSCLSRPWTVGYSIWSLGLQGNSESMSHCAFTYDVPFLQHCSLPCLCGELLFFQDSAHTSLCPWTLFRLNDVLIPLLVCTCYSGFLIGLRVCRSQGDGSPLGAGTVCLISGLLFPVLSTGPGQHGYFMKVWWVNKWLIWK